MDWSLRRIRAPLAGVTRQVYNRALKAISPKRRHLLHEVQRFSHQVQAAPDSSSIGQALVSAIAQGIAAEGVLLFLPHFNQDKLVVAASEGVDEPCSMSLQPSSPFLAWLDEQRRVVAAMEILPLPQWQGLPTSEREPLSAFGCQLFASMQTGSANNALLVVGKRRDGAAYTQEEVESLELMIHQAAAAMEIARLRHQLVQQQQELHKARGQMASSTRMTTIGEAISATAQEIEGSLRTISMLVDGMSGEVDGQGASGHTMDSIKAEVIHAHDSLLPILDLVNEDQWTWGEHNLNSLLSSVVSEGGIGAARNRVEFALHLDTGEPLVWCDEKRMKQVFANLVANALDAMHQEGLFTISTKTIGDIVEIKFTDSGVGIPLEHLGRVFDTLFTSKPEGKGSGIGLASSRRTVEQHQGSITVESVVGEGTTVTVVLPVRPTDRVVHGNRTQRPPTR